MMHGRGNLAQAVESLKRNALISTTAFIRFS